MATTSKRLFGPAQLGTVAATVYTAPTAVAVIKRGRVSNPTGSAQTFTMALGADAAGTRIYSAVTVPAGQALNIYGPFSLVLGDIVQAYGSSASLVLELDGIESETGVPALQASANGRYLRTASNTPVRIKSDAAWINYCNFNNANQDTYFAGVAALGFNATTLMGIVKNSATWGVVNEPANFDGDQPFTGATFSTPNPAYFSKLSGYIDRAAAHGLYVMFFHTYDGAGSDGWDADLIASTNSIVFNWGAYLGTTFPQTNIIWMHMGDRTATGTSLTRWQNLIAGIQSVTRNRLSGCELDGPNSIITDQAGVTLGLNPATSDMQISSFYGQGAAQNGQTYVEAIASYALSAANTCGAAYQTEPNYIAAFYDPKNSRSDIRAMICWALATGSLGGTNFGQDERWDGRSGMLASLTASATADMSRINALFDSLFWWLMQPSGTSVLCPIRGAGTYVGLCGRILITARGGGSNSADAGFISAQLSSDSSQLMAYVPPTGAGTTQFNVDFRSMSGTCTAYWWNPTTAVFTTIGTFANSLSAQSFTTLGDNGTGVNDWFLICKVPS